jgi:hypothetical protein
MCCEKSGIENLFLTFLLFFLSSKSRFWPNNKSRMYLIENTGTSDIQIRMIAYVMEEAHYDVC